DVVLGGAEIAPPALFDDAVGPVAGIVEDGRVHVLPRRLHLAALLHHLLHHIIFVCRIAGGWCATHAPLHDSGIAVLARALVEGRRPAGIIDGRRCALTGEPVIGGRWGGIP